MPPGTGAEVIVLGSHHVDLDVASERAKYFSGAPGMKIRGHYIHVVYAPPAQFIDYDDGLFPRGMGVHWETEEILFGVPVFDSEGDGQGALGITIHAFGPIDDCQRSEPAADKIACLEYPIA